MTTLVHGAAAAGAAEAASAVLFGGDPTPGRPGHLRDGGRSSWAWSRSTATSWAVASPSTPWLAAAGWPRSASDARRGLAAGEVRVNGRRVAQDDQVGAADLAPRPVPARAPAQQEALRAGPGWRAAASGC